jgi:hypothetical protein
MFRSHISTTDIKGLHCRKGTTDHEMDLQFVVTTEGVRVNLNLDKTKASLLFDPPTIRHITYSVGRSIRDVMLSKLFT